jgi:hypothetical protein
MGTTTELRRELREKFFPYAGARGFAADLRLQPRSAIFRRSAGSRVQMFEVQWEKYGAPRIALHFGTCPAGGVLVNGTTYAPEETLPTWCTDVGTLQPRRGFSSRSWFRQDSTLLQRLLGRPALRAAADVVDELLAYFPEVEHYWTSGDVGRHLRMWGRDSAKIPDC